MKKKTKKQVKVPAHMFGMFAQIGQAVEGIGDSLKESGMGDLGQAISGAVNPAKAGLQYLGNKDVSVGNKLLAFTGIGSIFARRQAEKARKKREATAKDTAMGLNNAAAMQQEYWDDNSLAYTFENGGILPDLAYLDNNEVVRTQDGMISQIPNTRPGTDNHLVDASNLESVLSDNLKRPGTNRTFAQEGEKLTKMTKPSKGKDAFAENTNILNKRNANRKYNDLLLEQEEVKTKKGIKSKQKAIPSYANGADDLNKWNTIWNTPYDIAFGRTSATPQYNGLNNLTPAGRLPWVPYGNNTVEPETVTPSVKTGTKSTKVKANKKATSLELAPMLPLEMMEDVKLNPTVNHDLGLVTPLANANLSKKTTTPKSGGMSLGNIGNGLLDLAPSIYNMIQGLKKPETEENVTNPYAGTITSTMARRRMNINPAKEANRRSRAIANYNAANLNPNTGANLAFRTQAATSEYANNADMYATKQNADNAYLGEYASTLNNLGQQWVQGQRLANEQNAQNRAMSRNFMGTAMSQIGQYSQVRRQERNQADRDAMIYPFLKNFLAYGNTQDLISDLDNMYYKTRKRV